MHQKDIIGQFHGKEVQMLPDEKLDTREYDEDRALSFILNKIKEHYENI